MFRYLLAAMFWFSMPVSATEPVVPPPTPTQILALPAELRADFHQRVLDVERSPPRRLEQLVDYLFLPTGLGMQYQADATYTVAEAWAARRANCLSFTLLTIALAREAGLEAYGQEISEILAWRTVEKTIYLSNHVNAGVRIRGKRLTVDVALTEVIATEPPQMIGDARLFAHFYNNRAVALLNAGDLAAAMVHAEASLAQDQNFATSWSNLGVLHRHAGDEQRAFADFQQALTLDTEHPGALSNLAMYYSRNGERRRAGILLAKLESVQARDPLHQFMLALDAELGRDFEGAAKHYRRAIRLHEGEHSFHFGLARAYFQLGQTRAAERELRRAEALSSGEVRGRYQTKLEHLRALALAH
ncbi:MAG: tetratricopeptide repeat protein [Rhodanobacteraceae bacterium]|jgi:Flp pilus assembly protein TadD|nr:tetratricopeptide repeat protein [Rhodanobacteraceae bacterium]MBL0039940.1 tetratricopeptide repeat protein [Xanthomonadales bacterium]MBP6078583.1 tetratricopeptide repeat protein [Xanthomonadales bacterium]MBP7623158.1 tetratricopeptide repeat protein [Xanthomonadales bacterium]